MSIENVYVITGGAGGMGLACARALAAQGQLLLLDVADEQLERARIALLSDGARVDTQRCDVSSADDVTAVTGKVSGMGKFRALVHTAGLSPGMADGRRVLDVDLIGSVRITDAVYPLLEPGSSAVLIASIAGYSDIDPAVEALLDDPGADNFLDQVDRALGRPIDSSTAYLVAKRGVIRLVERLSGPWGRKGARTVAVAPGLIDTPMGRLELERPESRMDAMVEATPIQRPEQPLPGRAEDIATTVAFLVSDGASFISGCDIRVDGGLVAVGRQAVASG
jgi:NAD(P)-dependent dehydrogenase (short-subunit alcohol dehydrogenase family)